MTKFLIGYKESTLDDTDEIRIVDTTDENEAIRKYVKKYTISKEIFLDHVYGRAVNASFAEMFWMATDEEQEAWNDNMELLIEDAEFQRRVREFFADKPDFADSYLQHYYNDERDGEDTQYDSFPEEMLIEFAMKGDWAEFVVIPLDEIPEM